MTTESDAIIEETRESRRRMSEKAGHNPGKFIEYLKTFNRKYESQIKRYQELHCVNHAASERTE